MWITFGLFLAGSGHSAISGYLTGSTRARPVIAQLARDGQSRSAVSPGRRVPRGCPDRRHRLACAEARTPSIHVFGGGLVEGETAGLIADVTWS